MKKPAPRSRRINFSVSPELFGRIKLIAARHGCTPAQLVADKIDQIIPDQVCRKCGCSHLDPCFDEISGEPCSWADADLCSACEGKKKRCF